jgi:hypothetical protein
MGLEYERETIATSLRGVRFNNDMEVQVMMLLRSSTYGISLVRKSVKY